MSSSLHPCPGCGLALPPSDTAPYDGYYNTSAECWSVYSEVLAEEYSNAVLYGQVHQLTVDTYAVQHAGGGHPDKSVGIHLAGLYLMLEQDISPPEVPSFHSQLAQAVEAWPHFAPPDDPNDLPTVLEVGLADSMEEHAERSRAWAESIWAAWSAHHDAVSRLVDRHLDRESPAP